MRWISWCILVLLYSAVFSLPGKDGGGVQPAKRKGLLVIPGLGRPDRLETVAHNLRVLAEQFRSSDLSWDCVVYVYAPRDVTSFWSSSNDLRTVYHACGVIEVPNQRVAQNLYMVQPALINKTYSNVMVLLDDCKIQSQNTFDLTKMLKVMDTERLTVASPMVYYGVPHVITTSSVTTFHRGK
jgi:hypothetical protein